MRIVRTARAEEDLIEIWSYIAKENETAADLTLDALERKTRLLGLHPQIGRERPDIGKGVRSAISGAYLHPGTDCSRTAWKWFAMCI